MKIPISGRLLNLTRSLLLTMLSGSVLFPSIAHLENVSPSVPVYNYKTINAYPHDPQAFTQGLLFKDGFLYEGTGLNGRSSLRRTMLETGKVMKVHNLPQEFFGEGITVHGDKIIQLTWKTRIGFVYDKDSFKLLKTFSYPTEGWGITNDGKQLIMSDGTAYLYFLDPETFKETGRVEVLDGNTPVTRLNELEYVRGEVFANVWLTDRIVKIDPRTGKVKGWIDLEGLSPIKDGDKMKALNGIAYDAKDDRLFVTGKLWPKLYEIKVVPAK